MKMTTRLLTYLVCFLLLSGQIASTLASQACTDVWNNARERISSSCNQRLPNNTMCNASQPVSASPSSLFPSFAALGGHDTITSQLESVVAQDEAGIGGFAWLKIVTPANVTGLTGGQTVTLISFGNTRLVNNVSLALPELSLDDNDIGTARIRARSTTFKGSYIRAIPDPNFQTACIAGPSLCSNKDNLLHFVEEGEDMGIIGTNATRDSLLVHDDHATGWITASTCSVAKMVRAGRESQTWML